MNLAAEYTHPKRERFTLSVEYLYDFPLLNKSVQIKTNLGNVKSDVGWIQKLIMKWLERIVQRG